ncbi:MAG: hypothetical protein ACUVQG_06720 [Thermogutta sp.]
MTTTDRDECERILRANLKERAAELSELWQSVNDHWGYEDGIYRFYHQSFKVYRLQDSTLKIVEALQSLVPGRAMNPWFLEIIQQGTGREFTIEDNQRWTEVTRPIVEAFFHARYFLDMACRYNDPPNEQFLPSGWAALLTLYQLW